MPYFEVTSVPPGEAPLWVREKWVGLRLPLADESGSMFQGEVIGVLCSPNSRIAYWWARLTGRIKHESGYLVRCAPAIELLERASPEAAVWWRTEAPWVREQAAMFVFDSCAGHVVTGII